MKTVDSFQIHRLKCWPEPYDAVRSGDKTLELRKNDRNYKAGDVLILQAYDPACGMYLNAETEMLVTHVQTGFGLQDGYVALSIRPANLFTVACGCGQGFRTYDSAHTHCSDCL